MLSLLRAAGLPDGVINLVHGDGAEIGEVALAHRDLAAVHFTGSTATFRHLLRAVGAKSTDTAAIPAWSARRVARDSCSHTPRPISRRSPRQWWTVHSTTRARVLGRESPLVRFGVAPFRDRLVARTDALTVGDPTVPGTDLGAVITARQFAKHVDALARAR